MRLSDSRPAGRAGGWAGGREAHAAGCLCVATSIDCLSGGGSARRGCAAALAMNLRRACINCVPANML